MPSKHDPIQFAKYRGIHQTVMERYRRDGFIISDDLTFAWLGSNLLLLQGTIDCLGDIYIDVRKSIHVFEGSGNTALIGTVKYRYHVAIKDGANIFRYDSPHHSHNEDHHVHRYDPFGELKDSVAFVGEDGWPTLGEVIQEVKDWYYAHTDKLDYD